jgi:hypothetical protein
MTDFSDINCDCFICLQEQSTETKLLPIRLKNQNSYIKLCGCDGWIHDSCLDNWYQSKGCCPICRKTMRVNSDNEYEAESIKQCICCIISCVSLAVWLFYY